jgi:hypothetical protein
MHFVVVERYLRPVLEERDDAVFSRPQVPYMAFFMLTLMFLNGVYKHFTDSDARYTTTSTLSQKEKL